LSSRVLGAGRKVRVVDVIPVEEEDSPFVGLLRVERVRSWRWLAVMAPLYSSRCRMGAVHCGQPRQRSGSGVDRRKTGWSALLV
jgi:hypothetical protein